MRFPPHRAAMQNKYNKGLVNVINIIRVWLIYALRTYINNSFLNNFYQKLKKLSKSLTAFLILNTNFLKIIY